MNFTTRRNLNIHRIGCRPPPCLANHRLTSSGIPVQAPYRFNYRIHVPWRNQHSSRPIAKCSGHSTDGGSDHRKPYSGRFVQHFTLPPVKETCRSSVDLDVKFPQRLAVKTTKQHQSAI